MDLKKLKRDNAVLMASDNQEVMMAILKGEDMVIQNANSTILESWGKGKDVIGKSLFVVLPEILEQGIHTILLNVFKTGIPFHAYEMPVNVIRHGVLEPSFYTFVYQAQRNLQNEINGVAIIANEVTQEVLFRDKLAHNELRYENLIQSLPTAVYTCDAEGYIQLFNKAAAKLWGREPVIGKERWTGSWKLFSLDGAPIALDSSPMAMALKEGRIVPEMEIISEKPDGTKCFIRPHLQLIFNEKGEKAGAVNTLIDVTSIRKSQKELKIKEEHFYKKIQEDQVKHAHELENKILRRTREINVANAILEDKNLELEIAKGKLFSEYARSLIEASLDPLVTISVEGKITDLNQAMENITGKTRAHLIGTDFFEYFTDPEKARAVYQLVFDKGFVTDFPLTIRDHKATDVLFNGSLYKDELGNVLGAVVVARDITEQKLIEKELIEAKVFAELATLIAEEAKAKAESAALTAEVAVKSKQQFLSNMSHEIRTPMNAIIGFTKVMLKTDLSAKQMEYLSAIKLSGDALIVLINDILDLAKVDAGKMTFENTPFKLSLSIGAMLHLFETKIQEKNLALVKAYDERIPEVLLGDPVRLHQIILNLVSNSVKFTADGQISVSVKMINETAHDVTVEFAISDTGIGIEADKLETIFENFQQATATTSKQYGGTGLGLAIVKQLVEQQGGSVSLVSKVGEGSTFSFILTFQKTTQAVESEPEFQELDRHEIQTIKVLVVEDMPLNQLLMKTLLDDFGFERDIASNGKIAIEKLKSNSYDIILMDLHMPEMNGFEATEYIRKTMDLKIPIVALTADVTTVDLAKCRAVGMNDFLAKPVDERSLYGKIVGLVKKPVFDHEAHTMENEALKRLKYTNMNYLAERTKSNPALMMDMIEAFLEQTPPLVKAMKKSFQDKDWDGLYAAVHKMIPSFSIMGISADFEMMAKKIQEYAHTKQEAHQIPPMVLHLEKVLTHAFEELEDEFRALKNKKI